MEFKEKSLKVFIETTKCSECSTKVCIEACKTYGRELLKLKDGKPSVDYISTDEVIRRGSECLACELACQQRGKGAIRIEIPIKGLDEFVRGIPLAGGM